MRKQYTLSCIISSGLNSNTLESTTIKKLKNVASIGILKKYNVLCIRYKLW